MRVAYVAPFLRAPSGWRSLTVGVIGAMQRSGGVRPVVIVSTEDAPAAEELLPGSERLVVPGTQLLSPATLRGSLNAFRTWARTRSARLDAPALVHSLEAYPTGLVGSWLAARHQRPHVLTAAGTYAISWATAGRDRIRYEHVLRRAAAVLPISIGTANLMRTHFAAALDETRIRVVLLGTDYHRKVPRDVALYRRPAHPPIVLSVGAIKPRKGYLASLRAFAQVRRQIPDAEYRIVGRTDQPAYRQELEQILAAESIEGVRFLGDVSPQDLDRHYREASVFLLTPEPHGLAFEGFGLVYLEAGAYGLPVVATKTGGVADAVRQGQTGFLASPGDVDQIAGYILTLLREADLARRLGHANRDWAETLTWERFAVEQRAVYDQVLQRAG